MAQSNSHPPDWWMLRLTYVWSALRSQVRIETSDRLPDSQRGRLARSRATDARAGYPLGPHQTRTVEHSRRTPRLSTLRRSTADSKGFGWMQGHRTPLRGGRHAPRPPNTVRGRVLRASSAIPSHSVAMPDAGDSGLTDIHPTRAASSYRESLECLGECSRMTPERLPSGGVRSGWNVLDCGC